MTSLLLALVMAPPPVAPVPIAEIPAGCNAEFVASVVTIQDLIAAGKFDLARKRLAKIPNRELLVAVDTSGVPTDRRVDFTQWIRKGVERWNSPNFGFKVRLAQKSERPHLKLGFVTSLPVQTGESLPAGAVFFGSDGTGPAEAVVSLTRTAQKIPLTVREVSNETVYAIGATLGLERTVRVGSAMDRYDYVYRVDNQVSGPNVRVAREIQSLHDALAAQIDRKIAAPARRADLFFDPRELTGPPAVQGDQVKLAIQVSNRGTGELSYELMPDCSCFSLRPSGKIAPGQNVLVPVSIDTTEWPGDFQKVLQLYSNDPNEPRRQIPVRFRVEPRYRILGEDAGKVLIADDAGVTASYFIAISPKRKFNITSAKLEGIPGTVQIEPWQGEVADPEMREGKLPRTGYRLTLLAVPSGASGRGGGNILLQTDDPVLGVIRQIVYLQKGIVAMPESIYLGQIKSAPLEAIAIISRPNRGFKITRIVSDNPSFSAEHVALKGDWEYRVTIRFNGKASTGDLSAKLTIHTDDPKQPTLTVEVGGIVR